MSSRLKSTRVPEILGRIPVVTICGSTRHKSAWEEAHAALETHGVAALGVGSYMHADAETISDEQKVAFDLLHKRKIDMSDAILVLNIEGHIGQSTRSEIEYARARNTPVMFWEPTEEGSVFQK